MKNKKVLDNIRNTEAGHIQIDYRICCAFSNFLFEINANPPIKNVSKDCKRIKKRSLKRQNKLESLVSMSFTKTLPAINIQLVDDFPQFSVN